MGAMTPHLQWIPEDDVLLKNAVESCASLESLAKGAVQFSRRYTVKELQDRWCSLLYDPVIATEASANMLGIADSGFLDQSRPIKFEGARESTLTFGKRKKAESIRKCYYAMRKRICNEPFDMIGIDLLSRPSASNFRELPSTEGYLGIQGPDIDIGHHSFPESGPHAAEDNQFGGQNAFPYEDNNNNNNLSLDEDHPKELPMYDLFDHDGLENEENTCLEFGGGGPFRNFARSSCSIPQVPIWDDDSPDISLPLRIGEQDHGMAGPAFTIANETEDYLAELSNTLLCDDLLFVDNNGKEPIDKSYYDGFSSLLLDSPNQSGLPSGEVELPPDENLDEERKVVDIQVEASPSSISKVFGPEYRNGLICCTLNTEDPDVPSNEDVFLPFRCPSPVNSPLPRWKLEDSSHLGSSSVKDLPGPRKANGEPAITKKQTDKGFKCEVPKSGVQHAVVRNNVNIGHLSRINSANRTANCYIGGVVRRCSVETDRGKNRDCESVGDKRENGLDIRESRDDDNNNNNNNNVKVEISKVGSPNGELNCGKTVDSQAIDEPGVSDQEEWSENDVPYFSDVEAMILDMDLSPDESYLYTNPEVQRYRHEESKRTIIRLEQAADACTHRAIANHAAFAVLYGRCSKYFIKKAEVILGRATEESKVDIDLGREKNGGKISRRQAIIKMDVHGIFQMINVGKSSVHVNGEEVAPGRSSSLNSGCLVEVRGLAFIFETNRTRINQYMNSVVGCNPPLDHRSLHES